MTESDERPPTEQDALLPKSDDPERQDVDDGAPKIPGAKLQCILPALAIGVPLFILLTPNGLLTICLDLSCGHG
jgi:hypothetical protein